MGVIEEVKEALARRKFIPYFQPQYDVITRKMWSAEILARWIESDGSVIVPGYFVPELEMTGDILELDWYMLKEACIFLSKLDKQGVPKFPISINFSWKHINEQNTSGMLCEIVDSYKIPHQLIIIEVAESAILEAEEDVKVMLEEIRNEGFRIAVDDFGNGSFSLDLITDLTPDVLKIDRTFFLNGLGDEKDKLVLEGIFDFANRLHLNTVAEGIETEEQLTFLRNSGCKVVQGYIFDKPMPETHFIQKCKDNSADLDAEDILLTQSPAAAVQLLMDAIYTVSPSITYMNLTKNSYYVAQGEELGKRVNNSISSLDDRLANSVSSVYPDDRELYKKTLNVKSLLDAYERGEKFVDVIFRQIGDDGVYRKLAIKNVFVKNPAVNDVIAISFCTVLEEVEPIITPPPVKEEPEVPYHDPNSTTELVNVRRGDIVVQEKRDQVVVDKTAEEKTE
ncbi:MAG TPA: EAL domain-containing protein [Lachnospiraceae bacterium]|nr:EAL domain-containing protein [Lachnospiraceae bacterium]